MHTKLLASCVAAALSTGAAAAEPVPAAAPPAPPPPALFKDPVAGVELLHVKGGCFQMGDLYSAGQGNYGDAGQESEVPVHEVCVRDFYIGKYEVTLAQWEAVMGKSWPPLAACDLHDHCMTDGCPAGGMGWEGIQEFIRRLNAKTDGRFRLPTEAEWEYAARSGGRAERYSGGNDLESVSWSGATYVRPTDDSPVSHPVGQKAPNGLGLHDMSGNLWEFVADWWDDAYYARSPRDNPTGPESGTLHVKRGGCGHGVPGNSRSSRRRSTAASPCGLDGFRLARTP